MKIKLSFYVPGQGEVTSASVSYDAASLPPLAQVGDDVLFDDSQVGKIQRRNFIYLPNLVDITFFVELR